ncbi:DNA polymerase III subunit alpha [Herbaspirillum huttiense]|uniref:DNA polymerase III subunit alpha n=1 Tax=Herbaspirillum huttiense subsp. lycopersici TaxID=3074428 RepID=A0ABU2EG54_9BURK|nr:DNA polymerase III subunit alpha [Herbaspirillum huttiense]MDR9847123.1 DNA polymerase III subunit alpha [Herbaspirillum huttiense SE1]
MNINHALSVRSDFSIGQSLLQVEHIIDQAKKHGYESVALVDDMSIHNMVDFTNRAKKAGLKPIIGCRLRVVNDPTYRKPSKSSGEKEKPNPLVMIKAYVQDERGINSLLKLLSKANSPEYFYYHSRVGWDDVLELEGVAITTGDFYGLYSHPDEAFRELVVQKLRAKFQDLFVELTPVDTPLFDTMNGRALACLRANTGLRPLITYPFMYQADEDASTLDVLNVIATQGKMSVPYRPKQFVTNFSFQSAMEIGKKMVAAHKRQAQWNGVNEPQLWKDGLAGIEALAKSCAYEFKKHPVSLPTMAANEFDTLGKKCIAGWHTRFGTTVLGHKPGPADIPVYQERLRYELSVLKKMGFSGYFLLVEDLVTWAKSQGIIVGPGRGSVGGSLVAYLLGITDVDPIRFNLLFERFINPERLDLPDADLDFMSARRHEVIEYLAAKYGADRVAGISNFATMAAASALRDAGRVHEMSPLELSATKLVPKEHGVSFSLTEAAKAVPELEKFRDERPDIWNHALKLEGAMRSFGKHAAGVVVAGEPLINRAVVETRESSEGIPVVNWDKRVVEDWGLVKMDILGLSTLDTLEIARGYIKDRHGVDVRYVNLPLEEPDIMDAFARGDTTGVFQFESPGMKKLLRDLAKGGKLTFEDITAATALYRPGPMDSGLMDDFVAIKQGNREPFYEHPSMEAALKDTYSVIVYQEQVMQVAVDLAGFTRAEADHLRKAMGKKDKDKMAEMRDKWINGCLNKSGMGAGSAGDLFDKIEAFAGYGFNRSHAVEYSVISYWTMWLRVRYPAEYFAACLSIVADDKLPGLVADARSCGIEVLPPDINVSGPKFTIPDDKHLLAPFGRVKGLSDNTAARLVELRAAAGGAFKDMAHFEAVCGAKGSKVTSKHREALDKVGALASIQPGAKPARDLSRRKEQMELLPGLIIDAVKADRTTDVTEPHLKAKVIHIVQEYRKCEACDLAGQPHPAIRMAKNVKFMVVHDCPNWQEEKKDKLMEGDSALALKEAIKVAGLSPGDGYYTTLVKAKKQDKFLSNGQLNGCAQFLNRELELIKPPIIVALGSASIKRFMPGLKGGTAELVGKTFYDAKLDATIVFGINPQQLYHDPAKVEVLVGVFQKVAEILS